MLISPLLMVQENRRGSLEPDCSRPTMFLLLSKEHSKHWAHLEGLINFLDQVGGRRVVLIQAPFAQD